MNAASALVALASAAVAWVMLPRFGVGVLGQEIVLLLCFFIAATGFYCIQLLKLLIRLFLRFSMPTAGP